MIPFKNPSAADVDPTPGKTLPTTDCVTPIPTASGLDTT